MYTLYLSGSCSHLLMLGRDCIFRNIASFDDRLICIWITGVLNRDRNPVKSHSVANQGFLSYSNLLFS